MLKGILSTAAYEHFCALNIAMSILLEEDDVLRNGYIGYAKELLKFFVLEARNLYGEAFITYNVHSLIHLPDDCIYFKTSLNHLSAFPFENTLGSLKRLIRSSHNPVVQLVKRLHNKEWFKPITQATLQIAARFRDSFFYLNDGHLAHVIAITENNARIKVIFDYLHRPLFCINSTKSTQFGIIKIKKQNLNRLGIETITLDQISKKAVGLDCFDEDNYIVIMPMRHTII